MDFVKTLFVGLLAAGISAACADNNPPPSQPYHWQNVEVVGGGFVDGIEFSPAQKGLIYARTDIGGAYRWDVQAGRWIPLTDWVSAAEGNLLGTESIAVDPTDARRVYLAQGMYTQSWASNGAIFRSLDQGRTWQRADLPIKLGANENGRSIGERLTVDPNKDSILLFGSRKDGLWRSTDYGATWSRVSSFPVAGDTAGGIGVGFVLYDTKSGPVGSPTPTVYVGVANSPTPLYRSADAGATWSPVPGQPQGMVPHHAVLTPAGTLYVTYGDAPGPNGMSSGAVWKCAVRGSGAWTDITPVRPGAANNGTFGYAGLSVDAQHPDTVMVSTMDWWSQHDDVLRSTDGGAHWASLKAAAIVDNAGAPYLGPGGPKAVIGHWIGALEIDPFQSGHVLFGTGATLMGSDDATAADAGQPTHWTVRAQGVEETAVNVLLSPPSGAHLLSGMSDIGGFRHDDLSVSPAAGNYKNPPFSGTTGMDFAERTPAVVVRVGSTWDQTARHGGISQDGGRTWTPFGSEPPASGGGGGVALSADGKTILWTPDKSVLSYSRDGGATWTACADLPGTLRPIADRADSSRFYALDTDTGTLYVSTDSGINFHTAMTGLPTGAGKLRAVPGHPGDLWLAVGNHGLLHSVDAGAHFTPVDSPGNAEAVGFGKAAPSQTYPALYLVGTVDGVHGVFRSDNVGVAWTRINDDAHQYGWIGIDVSGDPRVYGRVYLATNGRGILTADPAPQTAAK